MARGSRSAAALRTGGCCAARIKAETYVRGAHEDLSDLHHPRHTDVAHPGSHWAAKKEPQLAPGPGRSEQQQSGPEGLLPAPADGMERQGSSVKAALPERPRQKQQAAPAEPKCTMEVVFGQARGLGIVFGSSDPLDQLWLEVDTDGDGQLGKDELGDLLRKMGRAQTEADVEAAWKELDSDNSESVDIAEFEAWYRQFKEVPKEESTPVEIVSVGACVPAPRARVACSPCASELCLSGCAGTRASAG